MAMIDVRSVKNPRRLLFRYDEETGEIEIKQRGEPAERVNLKNLSQASAGGTPIPGRTPGYR